MAQVNFFLLIMCNYLPLFSMCVSDICKHQHGAHCAYVSIKEHLSDHDGSPILATQLFRAAYCFLQSLVPVGVAACKPSPPARPASPVPSRLVTTGAHADPRVDDPFAWQVSSGLCKVMTMCCLISFCSDVMPLENINQACFLQRKKTVPQRCHASLRLQQQQQRQRREEVGDAHIFMLYSHMFV